MKTVIRETELADLIKLAVLKQQVWISTYATEGITDEFSSYVLSEYSVENVKSTIADNRRLIFLATNHECVIGCAEIILSPESPVNSVEPCIEISTIYVLEKFQGEGIGKKLLFKCISKIKQLGYNKVWLTVYHKNYKAINFYTKQNFNYIGETVFILGNEKYKNLILLKNIE